MINRQEEIHKKGFNFSTKARDAEYGARDFSKMRVGLRSVEDAVLELSGIDSNNLRGYNKQDVTDALANQDYSELRIISNYFYSVSGMYQLLCNYLAQIYRMDWYVVPYINGSDINETKVLKTFSNVLAFLDSSNVKTLYNRIAMKVIKEGCYYGYRVDNTEKIIIQDLPTDYCRSRYSIGSKPAIEFNMKFFNDKFRDTEYKYRVIKMFPKEFAKGYQLYITGKLIPDFAGDVSGWYLLEPDNAFKINLNGNDTPVLATAITSILDLAEAQELDRKKTMQQLLKIVIQKLPMDKNGDLLFDLDEAADIHNNAVLMLKRAIGIDVLTTFADIKVEDMADKSTTTTKDDLQRVERSVFNAAGISHNLFNTDGNLALEKSITTDEAAMKSLILQLEDLLNNCVSQFNTTPKKYRFAAKILGTTNNNYKELSKMYKEQSQIGYSKILSQVALGHSQSEILASLHFENDVLHLSELLMPEPKVAVAAKTAISGDKGGRPPLPDDEKSDKTIQNKEAQQ